MMSIKGSSLKAPLDEHLLPSVALAQRWGLYILLIARSQVHSTLSENLHSTLKLTWASECIQVHNPLPLTGTWGGAPYNGRWSTLIAGKINMYIYCNSFYFFLWPNQLQLYKVTITIASSLRNFFQFFSKNFMVIGNRPFSFFFSWGFVACRRGILAASWIKFESSFVSTYNCWSFLVFERNVGNEKPNLKSKKWGVHHHHYPFFTSPIPNLKNGGFHSKCLPHWTLCLFDLCPSLFNSLSSSSSQIQLNVFQY
jgi:hypothetical protein